MEKSSVWVKPSAPGRRRLLVAAALTLAAIILLRGVIAALLAQVGAAALMMAIALPLCRLLEKRFKPSAAAALSLAALFAFAAAMLLLIIPPMLGQLRQLIALFPSLMTWCAQQLERLQDWLSRRGLSVLSVRDGLLEQFQKSALSMAGSVMQGMSGAFSSMGTLFLSPLIAFYLLRDRRRIASALTLLAPVRHRARVVRAMREMRRETTGFLRGQMVICLVVAACTSLGLLIAGTPGWLILGILMGLMELVPYVGPWIAGIPAVLFALQGGPMAALWALAVILLVQQLEGSVLSPRLMSGAVRLHPLTILLAISAGGVLAGAWGMVLALPTVVSLRGIIRGLRT